MSYEKKVEEWYNKAIHETDEFVKFLLFYIALEVSMKLKHHSISDITRKNSIRDKFYSRINQDYLVELKHALDNTPHQNMQFKDDPRWSGTLDSVNDFEGIIKFIMRARNNLFHGDKELNEERDKFIVRYGNIILQPLVEAILL